jgi:hypothetical protein
LAYVYAHCNKAWSLWGDTKDATPHSFFGLGLCACSLQQSIVALG